MDVIWFHFDRDRARRRDQAGAQRERLARRGGDRGGPAAAGQGLDDRRHAHRHGADRGARPRRSKSLPRHFVLAATADRVFVFKAFGGADDVGPYILRIRPGERGSWPRTSVRLLDLPDGALSEGATLELAGTERLPVCRPNVGGDPSTDELIDLLSGGARPSREQSARQQRRQQDQEDLRRASELRPATTVSSRRTPRAGARTSTSPAGPRGAAWTSADAPRREATSASPARGAKTCCSTSCAVTGPAGRMASCATRRGSSARVLPGSSTAARGSAAAAVAAGWETSSMRSRRAAAVRRIRRVLLQGPVHLRRRARPAPRNA